MLFTAAQASRAQKDMDMPGNKKAGHKNATGSQTFQIVDVEKLDAARPAEAVREIVIAGKPALVKCDLLIVGGGVGGVAAAIAACERGLHVCLTEPTSWLGGQMTSQGVSALDENALVEGTGATRRYMELRRLIRQHYENLGAFRQTARFAPFLDPGNCWVSRLAFEPKVAVKVLSETLRPFMEKGSLRVFARTSPLAARTSNGKIRCVQCADLDTAKITEFRCRFCIDASELGELLPLAGVPYVSGAESRKQTGEAHAPEVANPENVQDFTYPFVVEFRAGENHTIARPLHYEEFLQKGKFSLLGYRMFEPATVVNADGLIGQYLPFWEYRRLIDHTNFPLSTFAHDIAMINWDSNDLRGENIIDASPIVAAERLALGKFLSLGFLYWLQTEVQRDDGSGRGYPELKLRADMLGTADGVAKYPYIRESRRIKARRTIVESDLTVSANPGCRARLFRDSVGIGHYPVDIHGTQDVPGAGQETRPFQIPAAALVQEKVRNLLPACKNIGSTHVTNGAYRLHPVEWAIGEAAGTLAAEALWRRTDFVRLTKNKRALACVQDRLLAKGAPLFWFNDVGPDHDAFVAVQYLSVHGLAPVSDVDLAFRPDEPVTRAQAAQAIFRLLRLAAVSDSPHTIADLAVEDPSYAASAVCVAHGLMELADGCNFAPDRPLSLQELTLLSGNEQLRQQKPADKLPQSDPVSRGEFAGWLYSLARLPRFLCRQ
jgi:hypothetical protein